MKTLEKTYNKNGFRFEEVSREGDVAIYRQICLDSGRAVGFEVFEVQKRPAWSLGGKDFPAKEGDPGSEKWGILGFTVHTILQAQEKAAVLQERARNRKLGFSAQSTGQSRKVV